MNLNKTGIIGTIATFVLSTVSPFQGYAGASFAQQAAGQPIFDCTGMQATSARLKAGLPVQEEWIRSTEAQLRAAEDGVSQSKAALQDIALKAARDLVVHQLETVRAFETAIENARGFSSLNRAKWLGRVDDIKEMAEGVDGVVKLGTAGLAGNNLGMLMQKNRATLQDFINQVQESGISDELGLKAATFAGPAGVLVVESFTVARDVSFALLEGRMSANEAAAARENLGQMRAAKSAVESRAYELDSILASDCAPRPTAPSDRILVETAAEPPSAPPEQTPPSSGGGASAGKVVGIVALVGGVGIGTWVGLKELNKFADGLTPDPQPGTGGSGGGSGGSGGGGGMTYLGGGVFNCTYNAGGVVSSCANSSIRVNITLRMSTGSSLKLFTNHIFSNGVVLSRTDPPGDVTFTGFSGGGWFDQCGPPVTQLRLVNTSVNPNLTIATVSGLSIPVTCR